MGWKIQRQFQESASFGFKDRSLHYAVSGFWGSPRKLKVEAGQVAAAALTSGIGLIGASDVAESSFDVRILAGGDVVQSASGTWDLQIVPPGIYRDETRAKGREQWQALSEKCAVKAGEVTELRYPGM